MYRYLVRMKCTLQIGAAKCKLSPGHFRGLGQQPNGIRIILNYEFLYETARRAAVPDDEIRWYVTAFFERNKFAKFKFKICLSQVSSTIYCMRKLYVVCIERLPSWARRRRRTLHNAAVRSALVIVSHWLQCQTPFTLTLNHAQLTASESQGTGLVRLTQKRTDTVEMSHHYAEYQLLSRTIGSLCHCNKPKLRPSKRRKHTQNATAPTEPALCSQKWRLRQRIWKCIGHCHSHRNRYFKSFCFSV